MTTALEELKAANEALEAALKRARAFRAKCDQEIQIAEEEQAALKLEILKARAVEDKDAYPVGTKVHHRTFTDVTGVVVESDGTGVSVLQNASQVPTHGFAAEEWVVIP